MQPLLSSGTDLGMNVLLRQVWGLTREWCACCATGELYSIRLLNAKGDKILSVLLNYDLEVPPSPPRRSALSLLFFGKGVFKPNPSSFEHRCSFYSSETVFCSSETASRNPFKCTLLYVFGLGKRVVTHLRLA